MSAFLRSGQRRSGHRRSTQSRSAALCFFAVSCLSVSAAQGADERFSDATGGDGGYTYVPTPKPSTEVDRDTDRLGWYVPDFAKVQTGGYRGRYTAGLGYAAFNDVLNIGLLYGYSPYEVNDSGVSTLSFEVAARPLEIRAGDFRLVPIEVGVGALYAIGSEFELSYPDRYSSGYYPPTALRALAYLGVELDWVPRGSVFERVGLYYQVSTIYTYAADLIRHSETASLSDSVASTLGYRAAF